MNVFDKFESSVRSYCRAFPTVFATAKGATLTDSEGREYIDFFAGAGALNYGHNPVEMKKALIDYIERDGISHALDMSTEAKAQFLQRFVDIILEPRGLSYKVMFPGPTGTNAVEAALKLARKVTGRTNVISFTNAFHGMTLGSLALTGNRGKREGANVPLEHVSRMPFDGYYGDDIDTLKLIEPLLSDAGSGVDQPAAFVVETVQGEGGINVASTRWLQGLQAMARRAGAMLIVDDIQAGCGRTGPFFSFERAGIEPDMVCLSKSISGYGLPMSVVLIDPDIDDWDPGEHNGTFRGNNTAFITASSALEYWRTNDLEKKVEEDGAYVRERLIQCVEKYELLCSDVRGVGLIQGLEFGVPGAASLVSMEAFKRGLIIETAGVEDQVLKVLPPLTIQRDELERGLSIIHEIIAEIAAGKSQGIHPS